MRTSESQVEDQVFEDQEPETSLFSVRNIAIGAGALVLVAGGTVFMYRKSLFGDKAVVSGPDGSQGQRVVPAPVPAPDADADVDADADADADAEQEEKEKEKRIQEKEEKEKRIQEEEEKEKDREELERTNLAEMEKEQRLLEKTITIIANRSRTNDHVNTNVPEGGKGSGSHKPLDTAIRFNIYNESLPKEEKPKMDLKYSFETQSGAQHKRATFEEFAPLYVNQFLAQTTDKIIKSPLPKDVIKKDAEGKYILPLRSKKSKKTVDMPFENLRAMKEFIGGEMKTEAKYKDYEIRYTKMIDEEKCRIPVATQATA